MSRRQPQRPSWQILGGIGLARPHTTEAGISHTHGLGPQEGSTVGWRRTWWKPGPRHLRDIKTDWNGPEFEPIAGVTLQQFVEITQGLQGAGGSPAAMGAIAEQHGITAAAWQQAFVGWEQRITTTPSLGIAMSKLYLGPGWTDRGHRG